MAPSENGAGILNRSPRPEKAYVVLIGMSGGGKSTTLNSQFDLNDKSDEECFSSKTQSICEYQVATGNQLGTSKKKMMVIDTPGFADTIASSDTPLYKRDSQILATLESFLVKHEELSACFPTAVFLVINFSDVRVDEERSHFVQLLKAIENIIKGGRLIDTNPATCNLVLVLTHLMNAPEELQTCPEPRVRLIQGLIKTFTSIPADIPVVMVENKGIDFKLKKVDNSYELPNGELFPLNLFTAFKNVADKSGNDAVADIIVDVFGSYAKLTKRLIKEEMLVGPETDCALKYHNIVTNEDTIVPKNEMTEILGQEWRKLSRQETGNNPIVLQIAKAIFTKDGIVSRSKIPKKAEDILKLVRQLTVNAMLEKTLYNIGIEPPSLIEHCNSVGYFYNASNDSMSTITPFVMIDEAITHSGFRAPRHMRVDFIANEKSKQHIAMNIHQSMSEYFSSRFKQSKLASQNLRVCNKNAKPVLGHNIIPDGVTPSQISGIREIREYSVKLTNNFQICPSYRKTIESLPVYNERTKHDWAANLGHGVHIIKSAYIGGTFSVTATNDKNVVQNNNVHAVKNAIRFILENAGKHDVTKQFESIKGWTFKLMFHGGDPNLTKPRLDNLFSESGRKLFNKWKQSIQLRPTLLFSELHLEHISAYLKSQYPVLADRVSIAAHGTMGYENYSIPQSSRPGAQNTRRTYSVRLANFFNWLFPS